jgi:hypothetical protein
MLILGMPWKRLLILIGLWSLVFSLCSGAGEADLYVYSDSSGAIRVTHTPLTGKGLKLLSTYRSPAKSKEDFSGDLERFAGEIRICSVRYGVEEELIRAVIKAESDFDPYAISVAGALGLMQLMPETAKRFGVEDSFDPMQNIDGGVRYLMKLNKMFEEPKLAIAAYHAGENRVAAYGDVPPIPATLEYVDRVLRYYKKFKKISGPARKIEKVILPNGKVLYTTSGGVSDKKGIRFKVE